MTPLFRKLNLKDHREIVVLNAPESFDTELTKLDAVTVVRKLGRMTNVEFALAFAISQAELDRVSKDLAARAKGDAIIWIAYPKGTSKRFRCEFNRDSGWSVLRGAGFESVRVVAIDEDWSALRFRRIEFVKEVTRDPKRKSADER